MVTQLLENLLKGEAGCSHAAFGNKLPPRHARTLVF